ncbi:MAG: DUF4956 domain-containing protein [Planctomycetes bacterium]|nr:DUF4956 domain-containing protein [Planctomycetota bacterium]
MPPTTLQDLLSTESNIIPWRDFIVNFLLTAALAAILRFVYIKYGTSLSNRRMFANTFLPIAMTTMLLIVIVKSSLALSLGLVGALSIVRFRSAIKEPEELAYLFINIAIGVGLGANQTLVTATGFIVLVAILSARSAFSQKVEHANLYVNITAQHPTSDVLENIVKVLERTASAATVKRFEETADLLDASFFVEYASFASLNESKAALQGIAGVTKVTFLDKQGFF